MATIRSEGLQGFGGWLLLLSFGVWISPLRTLSATLQLTEGVDARMLAIHHLTFTGEQVLFSLLIAMQVAVIYLMMKRSWRFVPMFLATASYAIFLPLLDLGWTSTVLSLVSGTPFWVFVDALQGHAIEYFVACMVTIAPWMLYVVRSRRVANTFVRGIRLVAVADTA